MEQRGFEGPATVLTRPRRKFGLETPLHGHFFRERYLVFSPPVWYDALVGGCVILGFLLSVLWFAGVPIPGPFFLWPAVCVAGLWGAVSSDRMTCDQRTKMYKRREGQGLRVKGSFSELDAVVLMTEVGPLGGRTIYRLVLFWKGHKQPLMVVERMDATLSPGAPLNHGAGPLFHKGQAYARALGVAFYDNAHFPSPAPVPLL